MINVPAVLKVCAVASTLAGIAIATAAYIEKKERDRKVQVVQRNIRDLTDLCNDLVSLHGQKSLSAGQLANLLEIRRRVSSGFSSMTYDEIMTLQSQIEVIYNILNSARH